MLAGKAIKYGIRLTLAIIVGLALVGFLPIPAQAQEPIDLVLGGEGATSWDIVNIQPGDSGTKIVTLHNAGYRDGFVTIWISDILNIEETNPESETGDTAEPGELGQYLLFNVSCSRLLTNLSLPTTINNLPQSPSSSSYIKVSRLNAGETIELDWQWELPAQTGNSVQGDSLSFTINYMLEELPSGGGGGGGGGSPPGPERLLLRVDMWGQVSAGERTEEGILVETIEAVSPDGVLILLLPQGTRVLDHTGNPLNLIEVKPVTPPKPPPDKLVIGPGYDIQPSCTLDPPIKIILYYDPQALSDGISEEDLVTAYYDQAQLVWTGMPTIVDTKVDTVTASLSHSSVFAILAESPAVVEVPSFSASVYNLRVTPSRVRMWGALPFAVRTGEEVTVTADVVNSGSQEGNYSVILKLNGHTRATQEITLEPEQSEQVIFILSGIEPGHYIVLVNGLTGEFVSSLWINWWLIVGGLLTALAATGGLAVWLYKRKRKSNSVPSLRNTPFSFKSGWESHLKSQQSGGRINQKGALSGASKPNFEAKLATW